MNNEDLERAGEDIAAGNAVKSDDIEESISIGNNLEDIDKLLLGSSVDNNVPNADA